MEIRSVILSDRSSISLDLVAASQNLLQFLEVVDKSGDLYEGPNVSNALRRYETIWLPLLASLPEPAREAILPPLDVYWIWVVHMLSPTAYRRDCEAVVGCVLDHTLSSTAERGRLLQASVVAWQQKCPQDPFDFRAAPAQSDTQFVSKVSYDIAAAVARQRMFNYQVPLALPPDGSTIGCLWP